MAVQVHGLRLFPPSFLLSWVLTHRHKGRGPHPHRWILVKGSICPLGYLWAALLVLFATGRSATMIVPGTHFLQAQLGVMLRGKLGVGPQALMAGPQLRQHGWVWLANGFWLFPPVTLVHPRLPISTFTKATHVGTPASWMILEADHPPPPPGLSSLPFVVTPVPSGTRFAPSRCLEPLLSPRNVFP